MLLHTEYTAETHSKATNWEGEYREVIQIAAIGVTKDLQQTWQLSFHVQPIFKPKLSDFIKGLTGITQAQVNIGLVLPTVLQIIETVRNETGYPICCYGHDGFVIDENCKLLQCRNPIPLHEFVDLRPLVEPTMLRFGADPNNFSSGKLLCAFGRKGMRVHDALSDVQNLLIALQEMRARSMF